MIYDNDDGKCHMFGSSMVSEEGIIKFCHLDVFFFILLRKIYLLPGRSKPTYLGALRIRPPPGLPEPLTEVFGRWPLSFVVIFRYKLGNSNPKLPESVFQNLEEGSQNSKTCQTCQIETLRKHFKEHTIIYIPMFFLLVCF